MNGIFQGKKSKRHDQDGSVPLRQENTGVFYESI